MQKYSARIADPVIDVVKASKSYGEVSAVDGVSLRVEAGEIYALLGLNGAGKTTLIRVLLGMVRPTAGRVALFGATIDRRTQRVWSDVGYLVETPAAYPELTVWENLEVVRRLRRVADRSVVDDTIERLGLGPYAHRRTRTLSLGNVQRLGLAKALLHRPRLLILDEPANGLDPAGVVEVRDMLRGLADDGTTVFLSSHVLAEVARLATRIGIIHSGRLREELTAAALADRVRRRLSVATRDDMAAAAVLTVAGYTVRADANGLVVDDPHAVEAPDDVAVALVRAGIPPVRLVADGEDLESYFLRVVGVHDA